MRKWKCHGICLAGLFGVLAVVVLATIARADDEPSAFDVLIIAEDGSIVDDASVWAESVHGTVKAAAMPSGMYLLEGVWKETIWLAVEHPSCGFLSFEAIPDGSSLLVIDLGEKFPDEPALPAGDNDLCQSAIPIAIPSLTSGSTIGATNDGTPFCGTSNTAPGVWYSVIGDGTTLTATFCFGGGTADYDSKITVYCAGCDLLVCVGGNDDTCSLQSEVSWCAEAGTEYLILVHGFSSATGNFTLNLTSDGSPCTPSVDCNPAVGACCFIDGSCSIETPDNCDAAGGQYQGDGTNCDDVSCEDLTPPNDLCEDAIGPLGVPSTTAGTTFAATVDNTPFCGTSNTAPGVWYTVIGTGNTMTASTCGPLFDYDTKLTVYCSCEELTCVVGDDDECTDGASGLLSTVTWCSQPGAEYLILVHGFSSQSGDFELFLSDDGVPCGGAIQCISLGACCVCEGDQAVCSIQSEADCEALGGVYLGDDTDCDLEPIVYESMPNLDIPDGEPGGVSDTITVAESMTITDLNVDLQIEHTFVGDLCITLEHDGVTVQLVARPGGDTGEVCHFGSPFGCGNDDYDIILDDEGTGGLIEDLCDPDMTSPPNYVPFEPLSAFDSMDATGDWTITVSDNANLDTGTLLGWSLHLPDPDAPAPCDVVPCEIELSLDIKPGSCPNSFNARNFGVLPTAILGTQDFDVSQVDVSTLVISRADGVGGSAGAIRTDVEDVGTPFEGELCDCHEIEGDGFLDLTIKFGSQEVAEALELGSVPSDTQVELCVSGMLLDGTAFVACDCVRIVGGAPGVISGSNPINNLE
jgi:subtilisin-like proprotein convertase family protein